MEIKKYVLSIVAVTLTLLFILVLVGTDSFPGTIKQGKVLPAADELLSETSLASKDESGVLTPSEGETEITAERTRTFKKFASTEKNKDGKTVYRVAGDLAPIHYKLDNEDVEEDYKEIDLTTVAGEGGADGDFKMTHNGFQMRVWNQKSDTKNAIYYIGRFERKGKWIEMAPLELYYENDKGATQTISTVVGGITPTVDNEQYHIAWKDAFGAGIDFRYNLNQNSLFKTVVINDDKSLPVPKIDTAGLKVKLSMSMLWDDTVSADDATIGTFDPATKSLVTDPAGAKTAPPTVEKAITTDLSYKYDDKDIWWLKKPIAWDSAEERRIFELGYNLKQTDTTIISIISLDSKVLESATFPFYIDTAIDEEQVGASSDDADEASLTGSYIYPCDGSIEKYTGFRFTSVPIPEGSTINSADITFYVSSYDDPTFYIDFEAADNPATFSDPSRMPDDLTLTGNEVFWDELSTGSPATSPDLSVPFQAVIDREGWTSGNDIVLGTFLTHDLLPTLKFRTKSYDSGVLNGAMFNATYTEASTIIISGACKKYDQSTGCADSETVKVAINGDLQAETGTTSSGAWSIADVTAPESGDVITVFVDGVGDELEAVAVTKYDGTDDIENLDLFERHLNIGSSDNQTVTNANLSQYDYSVSSDEDIFFDVDANNDLLVPAASTSSYSDQEIYIKASNTYQPDSASSGNATTPNLEIPTSATLTADGNTITLTDDGTPFTKTGTFNYDTSTFKYTSGSDTTITLITYYNLETKPSTSGGSGGWTASGAGDGNYNGDYTEAGSYNGKPYYTNSFSRVLHWDSGGYWFLGTELGSWEYYSDEADLPANPWQYDEELGNGPAPTVAAYEGGGAVYTLATGTLSVKGNYTNGDGTNAVTVNADTNDPTLDIDGNFTIADNATFQASGSGTFNLAGDWTNSGTFTHNSGTLTFDDSGQTSVISGSNTFNNFNCTTSDKELSFASGTTQTVAGTWTITGIADHHVILSRSGGSGSDQWNINPTNWSVDYVTPSNSNNQAGSEIDPDHYTDGGNNTNWFASVGPVNDSLTFKNPYSSNIAVADDTTEWTFEAKVSDADGPTDIDYVELRMANATDATQPYDSLKFKWTESTNTFSELADTQNAATLTSTGADATSAGNQWTLNFKIKLNNNFLNKDTNYAAELYSVDDSAQTDNDNYANIYQATALSLTLDLDANVLDFGNFLPGSVITDTSLATVTTNYPNGYTLSAQDDVTGAWSVLLHTDMVTRVADYTGTIETPTSWSGTGLGICLYEATDKEAKWGTGISESDSNNKYAGIPENTTEIHEKTGSPTVDNENHIGYKIVVPNTQKTGDYSGVLTFTATGALN